MTGNGRNSVNSEIPLWLRSNHNRNDGYIVSSALISPSLFPPFWGLSSSASARKPLGFEDIGWEVKFPNNSPPSSMVPLLLRSKQSQASSERASVQASFSLIPSRFKSKFTPLFPLVRSKPFPAVSKIKGLHAL